jgi:glycosyltransferase involved in cell wall biosynthesis
MSLSPKWPAATPQEAARTGAAGNGGDPSRPLRLLHVCAGNLYGGVEALLTTLAGGREACPGLEHEFAVCFPGRLGDELRQRGVMVHDLGPVRFRRPWQVWRARRRLREVLHRRRPDWVIGHASWPYALAVPPARRQGVPVAYWAHARPHWAGWPDWLAWRWRPALCLANSRYTADGIGRMFPGVDCVPFYCPVPEPAYQVSPEQRASLRAQLQTPADAVVIAMAARLDPYKGHDLLLEALGRLRSLSGWTCWLIGGAQRRQEAAYLSRLQRRAAALGLTERVRWLGQRRDVPALLACADIYCQPNRTAEPFGIAFVEALFAGLPVVTMAIGGALEIVDDSCGRLVPPGDVPAVAEALGELIADEKLRRRLGAAGPGRARALCHVPQQLAHLHHILAAASVPGADSP